MPRCPAPSACRRRLKWTGRWRRPRPGLGGITPGGHQRGCPRTCLCGCEHKPLLAIRLLPGRAALALAALDDNRPGVTRSAGLGFTARAVVLLRGHHRCTRAAVRTVLCQIQPSCGAAGTGRRCRRHCDLWARAPGPCGAHPGAGPRAPGRIPSRPSRRPAAVPRGCRATTLGKLVPVEVLPTLALLTPVTAQTPQHHWLRSSARPAPRRAGGISAWAPTAGARDGRSDVSMPRAGGACRWDGVGRRPGRLP
mmetsp:Transcript_56599/g.150944  ORF Transcript_56599/g.150944 Transcript_56599/m.150944 type:complete len:252 (+) Transcript_56599:2197-2952(+)